jgi:hypothetical protein
MSLFIHYRKLPGDGTVIGVLCLMRFDMSLSINESCLVMGQRWCFMLNEV